MDDYAAGIRCCITTAGTLRDAVGGKWRLAGGGVLG